MGKHYLLYLSLVLLLIVVTSAALAEPQSTVVWSCDAMAATPAGTSLTGDLYDSLAGGVRFKDSKTGDIALVCPILDNLNGVTLRSLRLTYRDGDGSSGPSVVSAALRRIRRTDGDVSTVANGAVASNDPGAPNSGPSGWATHQSGSPGNTLQHGVDLQNYYYYVQINLKRTDPGVPLSVMGVHLVN